MGAEMSDLKLLIQEPSKEDYAKYPATGAGNVEENPQMESRVLPIAYEVKKGSKILDIGCNDGTFIQLLKDKRGCDVYGVDIAKELVKQAKEKGLNVQVADVEKLPFEDGTFDYVVCMDVLSHLPDIDLALQEIRRVLKPNGILLGSVPHKILDIHNWHDRRFHRIYFEEQSLTEKLDKQFKLSYLRTLKGREFSVKLISSYLMDQPCEILFKCGGDKTNDWNEALQDKGILRVWFGFTQTPGTIYYRMSGYADKMQKLGVEVHYNPYDERDRDGASAWTRKCNWNQAERRFSNQHIINELFSLMKIADLSVFQVTSSESVLRYLTAFRDPKNLFPYHVKKPLVLEMDDWFFDIPSYNMASGPYYPNSGPEAIAYEQLKLADTVICSTQYLVEKIHQLLPDKQCYVVPNSIDFDIWDKLDMKRPDHEKNPDLIRIIYTGSGNHSKDLEIIKEPMMALIEEFSSLEFIYANQREDCFEKCGSERVKKYIGWEPLSRYPQLVASWEPDIGIAPLLDNEFNRVKSNLRWLEYSALKIPTIASKVYPFDNSIKNSEDGIVIGNSKQHWYEAMRGLIVEKGRRTDIGENAYKRVKRDFNMDDIAKRYKSILESIKREFKLPSTRMR
jgi:ubiquinone/menaquinone biosynthesis C-methylase UbiE